MFSTLVLFSTISFSYDSDPEAFIDQLVNDAISILSDKNISIVDRNKKWKL